MHSEGKLRRLALVAMVVATSVSTATAKYSGGGGTADDPYRIATADDLITLGETPDDYDKHFILTADVDLDPNLPGGKVFHKAIIAPDTNAVEAGFQGTSFNGVFNGNGHALSRVMVDGDSYVAVFGRLGPGAEVSDLGLEAVKIEGMGDNVGGLAASNAGRIAHSYSKARLIRGERATGGLVGINEGEIATSWSDGVVWSRERGGGLVGTNADRPGNPTVSSCYSTATVIGYGCAGGLVALNEGRVRKCRSTGSVSGMGGGDIGGLVGGNTGNISASCTAGKVTGFWSVGGLVGKNHGDVNTSCSTRTVSGDWYVGGLVGNNTGKVTASYASGRAEGERAVGGLVGFNSGVVARCYSAGAAAGEWSAPGGLIGATRKGSDATGCFWDKESSGLERSSGGRGFTTAEMQTASTFLDAGWDFIDETENGTEDIWWIDEGNDYPRLWWERSDGPPL